MTNACRNIRNKCSFVYLVRYQESLLIEHVYIRMTRTADRYYRIVFIFMLLYKS
jgi:hypothetical protein